MRTPGMFSRYISLKTKFNKKSNKLSYSIQNYDDRFNLLYLNLEGSLNGTIEAIIPQKPIKIMTAYEINKLIKKHKFNLYSYFEGKKVLVVGGSRGLGAYLVKAFSLLGAEVLFSYNKNKNDSLDIIRDL